MNSLSQEVNVPYHPAIKWSVVNEELVTMLSPIHAELANNVCSPCEAAEEFSTLITAHLRHHSLIHRDKTSSQQAFQHRDRAVVRLTKRLAAIKNNLRRKFPSNQSEFLNAVRVHNLSVKAMNELEFQRSSRKQEKAFRCNPWKFSKSVCKDASENGPTFSQLIYLFGIFQIYL